MAIKLEVRSKSENGFRRAGRHWGPDPVEVELEDEQAEQVMRESQLFVRRLDGGSMPGRESRAGAQPMFSGLEDGLKPVPSDKTGGDPTEEAKAKAKAPAAKTAANELPKGGDTLTPEQKAEQERLQAEQQKHSNRR